MVAADSASLRVPLGVPEFPSLAHLLLDFARCSWVSATM